MKLIFELTLNDLLIFNGYVQKTRGSKIKNYVIWGLLGVYLIYFMYNELRRGLDWGTLVIFGFVAGVTYLFSRRIFKPGESGTKRAVKQNPNLIGNRTVELSENILTYSTPTSNSTFQLDSFIEIEETGEHIYIFNGRTSAVIIPKRAFSNPSEIEELKSTIKSSIAS